MRRFALGWVAALAAHEALGAVVAARPVTTLAGASGVEAAAVGLALVGFWLLRLALIVVMPGVVALRVIRAFRR